MVRVSLSVRILASGESFGELFHFEDILFKVSGLVHFSVGPSVFSPARSIMLTIKIKVPLSLLGFASSHHDDITRSCHFATANDTIRDHPMTQFRGYFAILAIITLCYFRHKDVFSCIL